MSNAVGNMIQDIAFRIGHPRMEEPYSHPTILRAMNRVYQRINRECKAVQHSWSIDFASPGANDSLADGYFALPADMVRPFNIDPFRKYVPPDVWSDESSYKFTIKLGRIYFTGVTSDLSFTVLYISSGYTLVDNDTVSGTNINEPEWRDDLQQLLLYATAIEMSPKYPFRKDDIYNMTQLKEQLILERISPQEVIPEVAGPQMYDRMVEDPYE